MKLTLELRSIIRELANGPETQLDRSVATRLQELADEPDEEKVRQELQVIIDECVCGSLCSDFVVSVLDFLIRTLNDDRIPDDE